jgi:hypothetical protein
MPLQFNTSPYFNDYSEAKEFYDILMRPGFAVQARELNQLQTMVETQIQRFGSHLFADGSMVIPGQITYSQSLNWLKLQASFNSAAVDYDLLDPNSDVNNGATVVIQGVTSGVKAQIVMVDAGLNAIWIQYTATGTDNTTQIFQDNEVIKLVSNGVHVAQAIPQVGGVPTATGLTASAAIAEGVYFIFGRFIKVFSQQIRIADFNPIPSAQIGLQVVESIVTPEEDQSLTDNAAGSPNYAAPGAHRYKIDLQLVTKEISNAADENFVVLETVIGGVLQNQVTTTVYSEIGKTLARRTQDANGSFTTTPFTLSIREHLDDGAGNGGLYTAEEGGNAGLLAVGTSPGKAYVQGYEIQTIVTQYTPIRKAQDTSNIVNSRVRAFLGNYVYVNRLFGLPDYDKLPQVSLYPLAIVSDGTLPSGSPIGTATIRGIEFSQGTFQVVGQPGPIWKAYLTDINITTGGKTFADVRSFAVADGTLTCTANVLQELDLVNVVGNFTPGSTITDGTNVEHIYAWDTNTNFVISLPPNNASIGLNVPLTSSASGSAAIAARISLHDPIDNILVYPLPQKGVATVRDVNNNVTTTYTYRKVFPAVAESTGVVTFAVGSNEVFANVDLNDYVAVIETGSGAGKLIDVTNSSPVLTSGLTQLTFNAPSGTTVKLSASVVKEVAQEKTKTLNTTTKSVSSPGNVIQLDHCDCYTPVGIWLGTDDTGTNISNRYSFDTGMRDNYYDFGTLTLIPGTPPPGGAIFIRYQYFSHGSGDYFGVNSYSNFGAFDDWYSKIPYYTTATGTIYNLRDVLDFRPKRDESSPNTFQYPSGIGKLVRPNDDVITDFSYFLPRIDKFCLAPSGTWKIVAGSPALQPLPPHDPTDGSMVIATIALGAFTFGPKDTTVKMIDNRGYTMRDIGKLATRISHLEYYTALSLLEQQTSQFSIPDATTGLDRFQNGFVVDPFNDQHVADVNNADIKFSIDPVNQQLRPQYNSDSIDMLVNSDQSVNIEYQGQKSGNALITLPYTESLLITQPQASRPVNLNPYAVFQYRGIPVLTPATDTWMDTTKAPDVLVNDTSVYDAVQALGNQTNAFGTVWNSWTTDWVGTPTTQLISQSTSLSTPVSVPAPTATSDTDGNWTTPGTVLSQTSTTTTQTATTTQSGQSRQGIVSSLVGVPTTTVNNAIVAVALAPFMRTLDVGFSCQRLKPNTRHFVYFDDIEVTADCTPTGGSLGGAIVTDATGFCSGTFTIPANTFRVGLRVFRLVDDEQNRDNFIMSFGDASFQSSGIVETNQQTITTVVQPQIQKKTVSDSTIISTTTDNTVISTNTITTPQAVVPAPPPPPPPPDTPPPSPPPTFVPTPPTAPPILFTDPPSPPPDIDVSPDVDPLTNVQYHSIAVAQTAYFEAIFAGATPAQAEAAAEIAGAAAGGTTWTDPLAQSFMVKSLPDSYMLTSVGFFFETKDAVAPVTCQIVTMVNGTPTQTVVPFSECTVQAADVNATEDASLETRFHFQCPVILQSGVEYAFVLLSNSNAYNAWVATIGDLKLNTSNYISSTPYTGVLFKSQNASTWTPDQGSALMFNAYRAKFDNTVVGAAYFQNDEPALKTLPALSVITYNTSEYIRILHNDHNMSNGSYVTITIPSGAFGESYNGILVSNIVPTNSGHIRSASWASGVADTVIGSRTYIISNVEVDSYTIAIVNDSNVATPASASGHTGDPGITVTQNRTMDVLCPQVTEVGFQGTKVAWFFRAVTGQSVNGTEAPYVRDVQGSFPFTQFTPNLNHYFNAPRTVASTMNENNLVRQGTPFGNKSLVYLCQMSTQFDNLSPVIYTDRVSAICISNRIDNRTNSSTPPSNPSIAAAVFVDETQPTGQTGPNRYMTRVAQLSNVSDAIHLIVAVMRPPTSQVDAYYRVLPSDTNDVFTSQDFVLMTPDPGTDFSPAQSPTDFKDYYWTADNIGNFTQFQVKLVMRSSNSSLVPLCKDLRAIALDE